MKKKMKQRTSDPYFSIFINRFSILMFCFFHVVYKISNRKAFGAKASCTELTLPLVFFNELVKPYDMKINHP